MRTPTDQSFDHRPPRSPAHLRGHFRGGPGPMRPLRLKASPQSHRRRRSPEHLRRPSGGDAHGLVTASRTPAEGHLHDHHDKAVESTMPCASARPGLSLTSALTVPVAWLVACVYIGVPLALFTHHFSDRLLATVVATTLALAAAFGGVVRVLRATTRHPSSAYAYVNEPSPELTRLAPAAFPNWNGEPADYPQMAEA